MNSTRLTFAPLPSGRQPKTVNVVKTEAFGGLVEIALDGAETSR